MPSTYAPVEWPEPLHCDTTNRPARVLLWPSTFAEGVVVVECLGCGRHWDDNPARWSEHYPTR